MHVDALSSPAPLFAKLERGDIVIAAKLDRLFRSALDTAVRRSSFRSVPSLQRVQTSAPSRLEPGRELYSWFHLTLPCRLAASLSAAKSGDTGSIRFTIGSFALKRRER